MTLYLPLSYTFFSATTHIYFSTKATLVEVTFELIYCFCFKVFVNKYIKSSTKTTRNVFQIYHAKERVLTAIPATKIICCLQTDIMNLNK